MNASITKAGAVNKMLAEQRSTVDASCYLFGKLRLKALAATDTGSSEKTVAITLWERWLGDSNYALKDYIVGKSALKAAKGQYWPGGSDSSKYKISKVATSVMTDYYYKTEAHSDVPNTIEGYYGAWLSNKSDGK